MKFILTIDTEWDRKKDKKSPVTVKNLSRIKYFQKLCDKYNIKPVYFCTYEVLKNKEFIDFIYDYVKNNKVEIGAHLHPWSNPPFPYGDPEEEREYTSFPHEYPSDIFEKKMKNLTGLIAKKFGGPPVSYRAGRFGFRKEHIPILSKLGYKIDSSITPYTSHSNTKGWKLKGIDFSNYTYLHPNTLEYQGFLIKEIPITILPSQYGFWGLLKRLFLHKRKQDWFRIYPRTTFSDLMRIIDYANKNNLKTLVFMMHSNELDYKSNPYFNTKQKEEELFKLLERLFQTIRNLNIQSVTLKDYFEKMNKTNKLLIRQ